MGMMESVKTVFSKYADFSGRARRSEYWFFVLFNLIVGFAMSFIDGLITSLSGHTIMILSSVYCLATIVPGLAVGWRRLHDIGRSGACIFIALIPVVGAILVIVWLCQDSSLGSNEFGPNPKEKSSVSEFADITIQGDYLLLRCPKCGSNLRLARGVGKVMVRCPKCGCAFNVNT